MDTAAHGTGAFSRRRLLRSAAAAAAALPIFPSCRERAVAADAVRAAIPIGLTTASYSNLWRGDRERGAPGGAHTPAGFLELAIARGAAGVQMPIPASASEELRRLRERAESAGLWIEGSIELPRDEADAGRFDAHVRAAREAGARILRTVCLSGRRYETFGAADDWKRFHERSLRSVEIAAPILARHDALLAVENHKDFRSDELVAILRRLASDRLGVCVDTGNSIALLEDAAETVDALAPWALSCHLKDMDVEPWQDGFLLAEVPLGEGVLDIRGIIDRLRAARPEVHLNLEMITRDPLEVPCLTAKYNATLGGIPARDMARTLGLVRRRRREAPLPRSSGLGRDERLRIEDENVRRSLAWGGRG